MNLETCLLIFSSHSFLIPSIYCAFHPQKHYSTWFSLNTVTSNFLLSLYLTARFGDHSLWSLLPWMSLEPNEHTFGCQWNNPWEIFLDLEHTAPNTKCPFTIQHVFSPPFLNDLQSEVSTCLVYHFALTTDWPTTNIIYSLGEGQNMCCCQVSGRVRSSASHYKPKSSQNEIQQGFDMQEGNQLYHCSIFMLLKYVNCFSNRVS